MIKYYSFRQEATGLEHQLMIRIGALWKPSLAPAMQIHVRYSVMRFAGNAPDRISTGVDFLNYGITWESAEKMFQKLSEDPSLGTQVSALFQSHGKLVEGLGVLATDRSAVDETQPEGSKL